MPDINDIQYLLTLPTANYDVEDVVKFPPLSLSASSLTPMEKMYLGMLLITAQPKTVVEFGVLKAVTTTYICEFLERNAIGATVYGFDLPHQVKETRTANEQVQALESSGKLQLVPGSLPESFTEWATTFNGQIDLALVDARHTYPHVTSELEALWPYLSPFGVILCHDYDENDDHDGVRYALDHFAQRHPDAQMCHLSTPVTNMEQVLAGADESDPLGAFKQVSTLAVLRRRPYDMHDETLAAHMQVPLDQLRARQKPPKNDLIGRVGRKIKRMMGL